MNAISSDYYVWKHDRVRLFFFRVLSRVREGTGEIINACSVYPTVGITTLTLRVFVYTDYNQQAQKWSYILNGAIFLLIIAGLLWKKRKHLV